MCSDISSCSSFIIKEIEASNDSLLKIWKRSSHAEFVNIVKELRPYYPVVENQLKFFLKKMVLAEANDLAHHLANNRDTEKPRSAFCCGYLTIGGADRVLTLVANYLACRGHEVYVITLNHPRSEFKDVYHFHPDVIRMHLNVDHSWSRRIISIATLIGLTVWISNNKIPNEQLIEFSTSFRQSGIHYIQCDHYSFFYPLVRPETYGLYADGMKSYTHCSAVIACNSFVANIYKCFIPNVAMIHNPVSYSLKEIFPTKCREKIIICVGRFNDTIKRIDRALLVFKEVLGRHPDAKMIVIGRVDSSMRIPEGNTESIGRMIQRLGFSKEQLEMVGEKSDVRPYYKNASVLLMTSENEVFGMVLVEAGVFGLPSVIFDTPGLEDVIVQGKTGFVIQQDDIHGMAQKVSLLLEDDGLRKELGDNARKHVSTFSLSDIGDKWDRMIRHMAKCQDQDKINQILHREFFEEVEDKSVFNKRIVIEYDRHLSLILKRNAKRSYFNSFLTIHKIKSSICQLGVFATIRKVPSQLKGMLSNW